MKLVKIFFGGILIAFSLLLLISCESDGDIDWEAIKLDEDLTDCFWEYYPSIKSESPNGFDTDCDETLSPYLLKIFKCRGPVLDHGVCWYSSSSGIQCRSHGSNYGTFKGYLNNLVPNTMYALRGYLINLNYDTIYSPFPVIMETKAASTFPVEIKNDSTISIGGSVCLTDVSVAKRGVCWVSTINTYGYPTISDNVVEPNSVTNNFSVEITNLDRQSVHYFRSFFTTTAGYTYYGNLVCFTF